MEQWYSRMGQTSRTAHCVRLTAKLNKDRQMLSVADVFAIDHLDGVTLRKIVMIFLLACTHSACRL